MIGKKKKKQPVLLADDFAAIYGQQQWGNQWHLFSLVRHWSEVAGKDVGAHSMPAYFRRDILWVYVQESVWMQHMHLVKVDLLARVNTFLQGRLTVNDLRWMLQPTELIDVAVEEYVSPPISVDPAAEREFRTMAENIADPDTREAFCNLWLRLTTKKNRE